MATNTDRNNVKPVFRRITPMVVMPCLFAADNAKSSCHFRQCSFDNSVHYGAFGAALVWVTSAVPFMVSDEFFGMVPLVPFVYLSTLVSIFSRPSALILSHACFTPREITIAITLVWLKLRNWLTRTALRTSLGFHSCSNNNAPHACPVKLPRRHIKHERRSYQYSTRARRLGNHYYTTGEQV